VDSAIFIALLTMEALLRKGNLKWCPQMELELVNQVFMIGAFQRKANDQLEAKFKQVVANLWKLAIFQDKGQPVAWNTLQHKYQTLMKAFRVKHGFGDEGERANLSALPKDSSEIDLQLEIMHNLTVRKEKCVVASKLIEVENKKVISDITDAVVSGGGKEALLDLSSSVASTSTSSSTAGVREFGAMSKGKKRLRSATVSDESQGMKMLRDLITVDSARFEAEKAQNEIARNEASSTLEMIKNVAAELKDAIANIKN
jgi:hypothetical protein